ncbi:MAG: tetratricopeptide (TPR) repeat protein [Crocinitomix sp.]|jgi:tetratricopeptide (TPR) repeat protein
MKITITITLICAIIFGCQPRPETNPNALTEPLTLENKEVGWKIEVPAGWEIISEDETKESDQRGVDAIVEAVDIEVDMSGFLNLLNIQKDESNFLNIYAEPFFEEYLGEWELTNQYTQDILVATYESQGVSPKISPVSIAEISGLEFRTYTADLSANRSGKKVKQTFYSRLHNGYDLSAILTFTDETINEEMTEIWKSSVLVTIELPDSIKTHYAEMNSDYDTYILDADGGFAQKKYGVAKFWYQKANDLNPLDDYAKNQLVKCELFVDEVSQQEMAKLELDWQYQKVIAKADELFNTNHYLDAHSYYQRALAFKPEDQYPKNKMTEAAEIIRLDYPDWTP